MKVIEFFGPPCSGKSYYNNFIKNKLYPNYINSDLLIYKYSKNYIKLTILDHIALKYFKFIKNSKSRIKRINKNLIKNNHHIKKNFVSYFLLIRYRNIFEKLFLKYKNKNKKFVYFYLSLISKLPKSEREKHTVWVKELFAKYLIIENNKSLKKFVIFDEGIAQRVSIILKVKKNKLININNYINLMPKPDYLIYLDNNTKKLFTISNKRLKTDGIFKYKNIKEVKKYKNFFNTFFKKIKFYKK
tara:strand:- start:96 stop:827 length:732 start_codon:yes stop_codon:yes gene_type:complete